MLIKLTHPKDKFSGLDHSRLTSLLGYEPKTGFLRWKVFMSPYGRVGKVAGTKLQTGYIKISINGRQFLAHRLIWFHVHGKWPAQHLDHINGDRADNRLANLREATASQNHANTCLPSNNKTGVKGVWFSKAHNRWVAEMVVRQQKKFLGRYRSLEEAKQARLDAEREHFGEYAQTRIGDVNGRRR